MRHTIPNELLLNATQVDVETVQVPDGTPILVITCYYRDGSRLALTVDMFDGALIGCRTFAGIGLAKQCTKSE
jgi:hypothetical protein